MASSDWMNQLAKKSPAYKAGVLVAVLVVVGLLYWQFLYSPLKDEKSSAKSQYDRLKKKHDELKREEDQWEQLILDKDRLDKQLKQVKVSLPASSELPSFFRHLQKQAAAAGVTLKNWKRLKEEPVESYVKVPVSIEISGSFYEINHYFYLLHETERIITVENFSISEPSMRGDTVHLTSEFIASTFRQADKPPDTSFPSAEEVKSEEESEKKDDED